MNIGCVVLASGESVRFGSNKLLADFLGRPVLACLLDALPPELDTVVVTRSPAVQALAAARGFRFPRLASHPGSAARARPRSAAGKGFPPVRR